MGMPDQPIEIALLLLLAFVVGSLLGRGLRRLSRADTADLPELSGSGRRDLANEVDDRRDVGRIVE